LSISATLTCFFSIVLSAATFFASYMRVPAASSIMPSTSGGFMLSTFVMRPCIGGGAADGQRRQVAAS
jgi:hypothetical protein